METLILERTTPIDVLFSFIGASDMVRVEKSPDKTTLTPIIDPDDYDSDAEYLAAIPGMMESIIASVNAPKSERKPVPRELFNVQS